MYSENDEKSGMYVVPLCKKKGRVQKYTSVGAAVEISTVQTPSETQNNRFDTVGEFMYSVHLITAA